MSFTIKVADISFIAKQGIVIVVVVVQLCSGSFFAEWTSQKNKKPPNSHSIARMSKVHSPLLNKMDYL